MSKTYIFKEVGFCGLEDGPCKCPGLLVTLDELDESIIGYEKYQSSVTFHVDMDDYFDRVGLAHGDYGCERCPHDSKNHTAV